MLLVHPTLRVSSTKVDDPRVVLVIDQHIVRLNVAPDDASTVQEVYGRAYLALPFAAQVGRQVCPQGACQCRPAAVDESQEKSKNLSIIASYDSVKA